jgi:hypothetical protein
MSANLIPITSDGGFTTTGNVVVGGSITLTGNLVGTDASPAPSLSGFSSVSALNITANGNITASLFNGDGGNISNVSVAVANITGIGNISTINLNGSSSDVLYGNGVFAPQSGGGGGSSDYGNSNVSALLSSYGSNTVSTTGNITGGNIIATANVLGSGYARFSGTFDESQASTSGLYLGHAGGTPRMMFGTGNTIQTFEIDNDGGTLRFYQPGSTKASLTSDGVFTAIGNVTGANILTGGNFALTSNAGRINFNTGAYITANGASISREGSIILSPAATGTFPGVVIGGAGRLMAPNGSVHQIFNVSDVTIQVPLKTPAYAASSTTTGSIQAAGGIGVSGNIYVSGGFAATGNTAIVAGASGTLLANSTAAFTSNINSYSQITYQNKNTGADATADFILTADNGSDTVNYGDFGIINSGYDNNTPTNSLGNIVYAADTYLYAQGNSGNLSQSGGNLAIGTTVSGKTVKIFAGGATANSIIATVSNTGVAVNGNVTASNFIGNISITGNVTGTSSNVTLVAGSYSATMDNTGYFSAPTIKSTNSTGNEGGEIQLAKSPNASISGTAIIDSYNDRIRFFESGGNTRGAYIDFTQAADGVGTLLNNRVSGLVNAGTFVTMDLLKATVTSSGNRGLSLAATTGSFNINISGTYGSSGGSSGTSGTATITTTPSGSQFNWNFVSQGDGSTYIITDTTNNRAYRITLQIGGSFLNNMISIERLV